MVQIHYYDERVLLMALTEARKRANQKYIAKNYTQVKLSMPKEEAEALTQYCKEHGKTKAGFIRDLIKREIGKTED